MSDKSQLPASHPRSLIIVIACLLATTLGGSFTSCGGSGEKPEGKANAAGTDREAKRGEGREVELSEETLKAAKIETTEVTEEAAGETLRVTGSVETNQQQTQQVTPLVSGRVERVNVALGDRVGRGAVLAIVSSPEVAEMHGKLHEAETRLNLAQQTLARVRRRPA